jgi:predicted nucleotidyltransferase
LLKRLRRTQLRKFSKSEIENIVDQHLVKIRELCDPEEVILFGSALTDAFDEMSDIDFVLIFPSEEIAKESSRKLYRAHNKPSAADYLCIDRSTFDRKSKIGGVYFIAKNDGKQVWNRKIDNSHG